MQYYEIASRIITRKRCCLNEGKLEFANGKGNTVRISENPLSDQTDKMLARFHGDLRGFLQDNDLLVWNASAAVHPEVTKARGIEGWPIWIIQRGSDVAVVARHVVKGFAGDIAMVHDIRNHAALRRACGGSFQLFVQMHDETPEPFDWQKWFSKKAVAYLIAQQIKRSGSNTEQILNAAKAGTGPSILMKIVNAAQANGYLMDDVFDEATNLLNSNDVSTNRHWEGSNENPIEEMTQTGTANGFLHKETLAQAATAMLADPKFQDWFSGSKAIKNGKPMLLYHGTQKDFSKFDRKHDFSGMNDDGEDAGGFYFTTIGKMAARYANRTGRVVPAFLRILNPYRVTEKQWGLGEGLSPLEAHEADYDGYVISGQEGGQTWIVFDPENIREILQTTIRK